MGCSGAEACRKPPREGSNQAGCTPNKEAWQEVARGQAHCQPRVAPAAPPLLLLPQLQCSPRLQCLGGVPLKRRQSWS